MLKFWEYPFVINRKKSTNINGGKLLVTSTNIFNTLDWMPKQERRIKVEISIEKKKI